MESKTIFEWAEMFQEQIHNGASQSDIIQMLQDYGKQALHIHDVVGQSEQLECEHKGRRIATELVEYCEDCKKILFHP